MKQISATIIVVSFFIVQAFAQEFKFELNTATVADDTVEISFTIKNISDGSCILVDGSNSNTDYADRTKIRMDLTNPIIDHLAFKNFYIPLIRLNAGEEATFKVRKSTSLTSLKLAFITFEVLSLDSAPRKVIKKLMKNLARGNNWISGKDYYRLKQPVVHSVNFEKSESQWIMNTR